ncbi:MAG: hypothetical protein KDC53_09410 [Saprospiraceae bacterium]|nr:hypothetical protein [Saprospiraceae bacterium]
MVYSGQISSQDSEENKGKETLFERLAGCTDLKVVLEGQIDSLIIMKMKPFETKGKMIFSSEESEFEIPVKISVRGKFRRRTCDFPPIALDFPKDDLKELGLKKDDNYKLVTICLDRRDAQNYLFREYLVYKMYQEVEPTGFGAVLFPIIYKDTDFRKNRRSFAVLLESNEELKDRLDGKWCDCMGLNMDSINDYYRELVTFFQYMIGNKDMNMHIEHNVRFLEGEQYVKKVPIPYDFDFSAFVRAPYAFTDQSVTFDRSPLVMGKNAEQLDKVLNLFLEKKERFFTIVEEFRLMSKKHKKQCLKFLRDFYKIIERPNFTTRYLEQRAF